MGIYSFSWNLNSTGTYYIRTSWSGNSDCAGADSEILSVFLGFPKYLIQFKGPNYYFTYGRAYVASYELRIMQGIENFLDIKLSGTGILLTGEFIILKSGQTITIPITGKTKESTEKIQIPKGYQPLRLPANIEHTTNNQFGLILRKSGENNYTLNVRGLDFYDVAKIDQLSGNGTTFMNTTAALSENQWYKVLAKMSEDEIIAEIYDTNGTLIESIETTENLLNVSELVVLLTNNTDRAIAFKDLNVETLNQTAQPYKNPEKATNDIELLSYLVTLAILVSALLATTAYVKKYRHIEKNEKRTKNLS